MFNFLSKKKKIPALEAERIALVRQLLRMRTQRYPDVANVFESNGTCLEDLDNTILMMLPEASVVLIVEHYTTGRDQGARDEILIPLLNSGHAKSLSLSGLNLPELTPPLSLERYISHYLRYIHSHGVAVAEEFIPIAIREVLSFYGRK